MISRAELDAYFERVPEHVLTVLDEAYFEYVDEPDYPGRDRGVLQARDAGSLVLRTFSKIYGLAGCASATGSARPTSSQAIGKVRNAFDINQAAQDAALASLGNAGRDRPPARC